MCIEAVGYKATRNSSMNRVPPDALLMSDLCNIRALAHNVVSNSREENVFHRKVDIESEKLAFDIMLWRKLGKKIPHCKLHKKIVKGCDVCSEVQNYRILVARCYRIKRLQLEVLGLACDTPFSYNDFRSVCVNHEVGSIAVCPSCQAYSLFADVAREFATFECFQTSLDGVT